MTNGEWGIRRQQGAVERSAGLDEMVEGDVEGPGVRDGHGPLQRLLGPALGLGDGGFSRPGLRLPAAARPSQPCWRVRLLALFGVLGLRQCGSIWR